jgi:ribosomal protein L7/L12
MTVTEQTDSWRTVIESRDLDIEEADAPDDSDEPWFQVIARFTKRGFLRAIVSPGDEAVAVHVQLAVPDADEHYGERLMRHFNSVSNASWETDFNERPWVLDVQALPQKSLAVVIDTLEMVGDHIGRAESGEAAESLADEFGEDVLQADNDDVDEDGADEPTSEPTDKTPDGVFESIGDGETSQASTGDAVLDTFSIRVADGTVRVELDLVNRLDDRVEAQLLSALARTLRARFDIKLLARSLADNHGTPVVKLALESVTLGATSQATLGELSHDLGRYFERLKKFNTMGMSLLDVLSPSSTTPSSKRTPKRPKGSETRDKPDDQRRADSDDTADSGVVFSFGASQPDSTASDVIAAGDFTDSRVRREDATTPLVDVVLRHPGYTDKSMRQVLSILLDVDYFEAGKLAEQAPCVIAWGISQERAQEFKRVIERAGGRVTLVEPDSLSS